MSDMQPPEVLAYINSTEMGWKRTFGCAEWEKVVPVLLEMVQTWDTPVLTYMVKHELIRRELTRCKSAEEKADWYRHAERSVDWDMHHEHPDNTECHWPTLVSNGRITPWLRSRLMDIVYRRKHDIVHMHREPGQS